MTESTQKNSIRSILSNKRTTSFGKYKNLTVGDKGFMHLVLHEIIAMFLAPLPGALGLVMRRIVYRWIFRRCGEGLIVGRNCVFRHSSKITIGREVTIDDLSLIDARGADEKGIVLGDGVIVNRNSIILSKGGDILIGRSVSIGANAIFVSRGGIRIEDGAVIAGGCGIAAGKFDYSDLNMSVAEQDMHTVGPIVIGRNVWLARGVTILDGVRIGEDSIISAGSVVTGNIPPRSVAFGNPARVVFTRR
jgi:acetyltransferase-like isoleucine patch superfamily enzyme